MEEFVVKSLTGGDKEAQMQAAMELSNLSRKQRQKIAEKGVISPLILMLQSQENEVIEVALSALLSLAFGSERNKVRIVKSGVVPLLLEILQSETRLLLIELAMAFLLILSSNGISIQAQVDAMSTLHNLSTHGQVVPWIISSGATFTLLQIINFSDKSSEVAEKATALLESIISYSPDSICSINGAIGVLVEVIEEGSAKCQEHAVGILLDVCKCDREKHRGMILREGVMPGLLQVSIDGDSRAKEMARELLLLLRDCSSYGFRPRQSKNAIVEQIMQEIDKDGERIPETTLRLVEEMIAKLST